MHECYTLTMEKGRLRFVPCDDTALNAELDKALERDEAPRNYAIVQRLGDPELLHCAVLRPVSEKTGRAGGLFLLRTQDEPLFAAVAPSNLAFAAALGYFGKMVSYARYGADIFENPDNDECDDG